MTAAGAQAEMVPGLDNARSRQSCRNEKQADAYLRLVGLGPYRIPFQDRRAGRIDLAPAEPPTGVGPARGCRRQAAARGRTEIGLDPERVDQRHAFDGLAGELARKPARPARASRHHQMLNVMHRQHQRRRWIALAEDVDDAGGIQRAGAVPAERRRYGERQQACFRQRLEILERKTPVTIMPGRPLRKFSRKPVDNLEQACG